MPEVFIGLGPRRDVSEQFLRDRISEVTDDYRLRVASKGAVAFCEVDSNDIMHRIILRLNGMKVGSSTITARVDNYNNTRSTHGYVENHPMKVNDISHCDTGKKRRRSNSSSRSGSSGYQSLQAYAHQHSLSYTNGDHARNSLPRHDETIEEFIVNINRVPEKDWDLTKLKISKVLNSVPLADNIDSHSVPSVGLFLALTKEAQYEMISRMFISGISIDYVCKQISLDSRVISAKMYGGLKALLVHRVSDWLGSDAYMKDMLVDIPENAIRKLDRMVSIPYDSHIS